MSSLGIDIQSYERYVYRTIIIYYISARSDHHQYNIFQQRLCLGDESPLYTCVYKHRVYLMLEVSILLSKTIQGKGNLFLRVYTIHWTGSDGVIVHGLNPKFGEVGGLGLDDRDGTRQGRVGTGTEGRRPTLSSLSDAGTTWSRRIHP